MLSEKVAQLRDRATNALTVAEFWESAIATHGESKATAFYKHIGLNHLETKSFEWEGLTLSREPSEVEKLCIKGIAQAQESGKEKLTAILLEARLALIDSALSAIKKLTPATYHKLILTMPDEFHDDIRDELKVIFGQGRSLVASELSQQGSKALPRVIEDDDDFDDYVDLTDARIANEIQSRITAAATRFRLLGLVGVALWDAVTNEINAGTVTYIDRASQGLANRLLNMGRLAEMNDRSDDIDRYEYSALLDPNTCGPCAQDDGRTASSPDDLPDTPNPECEGSDFCRCFIVAILDTVA